MEKDSEIPVDKVKQNLAMAMSSCLNEKLKGHSTHHTLSRFFQLLQFDAKCAIARLFVSLTIARFA